jgi:ribosome biogenesis GTPase / thiamine phosphate phosphatase
MPPSMELRDFGFNNELEPYRTSNLLSGFETGRVVAEHKERYIVRTVNGEYEAEVTGHLRYTAKTREDFPAVGDWVALTPFDSANAIIHQICPRSSVIKRQAAGGTAEVQVIAANIDYAFIVQAVDRDFNINRLERYLALCYSAPVKPIILLTKTDLADEVRIAEILTSIQLRIKDVPIIAISNETQRGYDTLAGIIEKSKTYCMLGSSGAGKSTLLNNLAGKEMMQTSAISNSTQKGRHTTSHRELIVLENGGILIDNPGMREVGIADTTDGVASVFGKIADLSPHCRFKDCTHTSEAGCAVTEAVEKGEISVDSYENFLKLEREKAYFEASLAERRKKDKDFGKFMKNYKKQMKGKSKPDF